MFLVKFSLSSQIGEKLTTWNILHEEKEEARVLREALQSNLIRETSNKVNFYY